MQFYLCPSCFFSVWRQTVATQLSKKSRSHPKILGARRGTWSKFHTENQQILGINVQTSVERANWWPVFVHPWYMKYCYLWYVTQSRDRRQKQDRTSWFTQFSWIKLEYRITGRVLQATCHLLLRLLTLHGFVMIAGQFTFPRRKQEYCRAVINMKKIKGKVLPRTGHEGLEGK